LGIGRPATCNSGGTLVNRRGQVVGVNSWYLVGGQNLNFAISVAEVQRLLDQPVVGIQSFAELNQKIAAEVDIGPIDPELPAELVQKTAPGLLHTFTHHESVVQDVAVSRDGAYLATGSLDKTCAIIRLADLSEVQRLKVEDTAFEALEFSVDGKQLFTGLGNNVLEERNLWVWDWEKGQKLADLLLPRRAT
jgi:WD40 repeat protein